MRTVNQILKVKGSDIWTVTPESSVYEALKLMADKNVGALLVLEAGKLVGIISERDYARGIILNEKLSMTTAVKEIMTKKVVYVHPTQTIQECMALMTGKHIRHLPVFENNQLVGVISIGDVVKAIIADQEFIIEQLENYIVSSG